MSKPGLSPPAPVSHPTPQPLREVRGPSALGGGRRRFFDLLWLMSRTEFKLGYHGTALGFAWSFVRTPRATIPNRFSASRAADEYRTMTIEERPRTQDFEELRWFPLPSEVLDEIRGRTKTPTGRHLVIRR